MTPFEFNDISIDNENLSDEIISVVARKEYYTLEDIIKEYPNERYARTTWQNLTTQEYVKVQLVDSINTGLVKHYRTTYPSYFKIVEHTFKPTTEDLNSKDWYIL